MAVVGGGERKGRRSTTESDDGTQSHVRVFYIETDDTADHGDRVVASPIIPSKGEAHPTDRNALVETRNPREIGPGHWEVDVTYNPRDPQDPDPTESNPTRKDPQIRISFQSRLVPLLAEVNGSISFEYLLGGGEFGVLRPASEKPIVNAAGEPFDPPVMRVQSFPIIEITRNETSFNSTQAQKFIDSVNQQHMNIAGFNLPPRCAMMKGISTPGIVWETTETGLQFFYFPVTYTIHVNMETFDIVLLEHGTYYVDASDGDKVKAFLTDEGQPRLGLLKADGDDNTGNDPVFRVVEDAQRKELWSDLRLPTALVSPFADDGGGGDGGAL